MLFFFGNMQKAAWRYCAIQAWVKSQIAVSEKNIEPFRQGSIRSRHAPIYNIFKGET